MSKDCIILLVRETSFVDGKRYRMVKCWCGAVMKLAGLGGHLYHKHQQRREDVNVID